MDAARWQRMQTLFHEALTRPDDERLAFLQAACADDDALLNEVLALLREDARGDSLLERDLAHVAHEIFEAGVPAFNTIGPYRVVRVLGRGGMGVVYLAENLGRRVAIKVLRDASLSPARRERFEKEQQTLAQLTHASIARLYEANVLADGTPYFVMEYVEGVPITEYCAARDCDVAQRLRLFRDTCEAVQFAHRHAVIHRDLKPSNILVTHDGAVKLLDFGIAKPLESLDRSTWTQTGQQLMTPAYAAPEQLRREPVGVYTDIYALGIVLYELLTDALPFELDELTPGQVEALILHREPDKPSVRAQLRTDASGRARLTRQQWMDLNVLCLTAMHKDPQRRYVGVESLLRDIDHYCNDQPLDARPDQLGYRFGKFVRRHQSAVIAVALAIAALVSLAVFHTVRLAEQRTVAQAEAEKARDVSEYLIGLFEAGDPFADQAATPDIRQILDRGVDRAESLAAHSTVQSQMFNVLGRVYTMLSEYERAEALLQRALQMRRAGDPLELADTLTNLAILHRYKSEYDSAEQFARESLAIREKLLPATHADLAKTLDALGVILSNRGEYDAAATTLGRALDIQRRAYPGPHPLLDHTLNNLAVNEFNRGKYDAAERYYREALEISRATYGPDHAYTAVDVANLGVLLDTKGDYQQADVMLTDALRITQLRLGEYHSETAFRMTQLGGMLRRKGDYDRAERYLRKSLEIEARVLEPNHRNHGITLNHLGLTLQEKGEHEAAEPFLRRSLEVFRLSVGDHHPFTATVMCSLGYVLHLQHDDAEAEQLLQTGLKMLTDTLPPGHDIIALNENRYGALLTARSRYAEAEPLLVRSYEVLRKTFGERHQDTRLAAERLATLYDAWNKPQKADPYRRARAATAAR